MRRLLATLAIVALGVAPTALPASAPAQPTAHASCKRAQTPGGVKCLAAGQFCSHKRGYAKAYRRAGFRCKRNGHLARR